MKPTKVLATFLSVALVLFGGIAYAQSPKVDVNAVPRIDPTTDHDVSDSRHNLGALGNHVTTAATNTDEVCVFCHTPHFSNTSAAAADAPLWNRNLSGATYTVYSSATMDTTPGQPDGRSVACLSCHDGTVALDSLINAPGPKGVNGYTVVPGNPNSTFANNPAFSLNWDFSEGTETFTAPVTMITLNSSRLLIGTDLSNDHPISMVYPTPAQDPGFNQPPGTPGSARAFINGIRTFDSDKVQCPSCHDPHLGDTAAAAKGLRPFLRVSNTGSAVCLTCHIK